MGRCERCGESNPGDAVYCGTCGLQLGGVAGLAALADDADVDEVSNDPSSERVRPPAFGETGSPIPPAQVAPLAEVTAAAPTTAMPVAPQQVSSSSVGGIGPVGDTRSTSVMIAALAIAIVVIVGGLAVLLTSGSGDDEAGVATVDTASPTAVAPTSPDDSSNPSTEVSAVDDPGTSEQTTAPEPTSPPSPAPTPPPTEAPTRGPGDLGLAQPILDEECDGRYITFVGSAVGAMPYEEEVATLLARYPNSNYIWTRACPSLRQEFRDGNDIYGVVFGPYLTQAEACDAVAFGPPDAYVRRISTTDPEDHTVEC